MATKRGGTPTDSSEDTGGATGRELPDGPADASGLTPRQQRVLTVIRESLVARGYPPSMREIGEKVGLTSSSSVAHQLRTLEEKGYIKRDPNRPRALSVAMPEDRSEEHTSELQSRQYLVCRLLL